MDTDNKKNLDIKFQPSSEGAGGWGEEIITLHVEDVR